MAVRFFADFNVPLTNDYLASRVTWSFLEKSGKRKWRFQHIQSPLIYRSSHIIFGWVRLVSCWIISFTCAHMCVYSNPHSITKQMAATSFSRSDFEIDLMFSKPQRSASPVFRKIRRCTPIWDGFCFGFNHVLSRFYSRERIHNPVSFSRGAFNNVLLWNWRILNKNI